MGSGQEADRVLMWAVALKPSSPVTTCETLLVPVGSWELLACAWNLQLFPLAALKWALPLAFAMLQGLIAGDYKFATGLPVYTLKTR